MIWVGGAVQHLYYDSSVQHHLGSRGSKLHPRSISSCLKDIVRIADCASLFTMLACQPNDVIRLPKEQFGCCSTHHFRRDTIHSLRLFDHKVVHTVSHSFVALAMYVGAPWMCIVQHGASLSSISQSALVQD